jgi:hypothetical protein
MSFVNPNHPKTQGAIDYALILAADLLPVTDAQQEAQTRIYRACASGELYDVAEALNSARRHGTAVWRKWESAWIRAVEHQILDPLRKNRPEAA